MCFGEPFLFSQLALKLLAFQATDAPLPIQQEHALKIFSLDTF
jgi:hypothetical protein